jgi:pyruvate,orthophosphate dikinase
LDKIESKALVDNLAVTAVQQIVIPEEGLWLLSCSKDYYGINQRTRLFLEELHHPYVNHEAVLKLMRQSILGDLWLYVKLPENVKALNLIMDIFLHLEQKTNQFKLQDRVLQEFLDFTAALAEQAEAPQQCLERALDILQQWYAKQPELFYPVSAFCRKALLKLAPRLHDTGETFLLLKDILTNNLHLWQQTCRLEDWLEDNKSILTLETEVITDKIGNAYYERNLKLLQKASRLEELSSVPSFSEIAALMRDTIADFTTIPEKIQYIFYLLGLPVMDDLSDHLLWDLNRVLSGMKQALSGKEIMALLDSVFATLTEFYKSHCSIVLDCVLTIGKALISPDDATLSKRCIRKIIDLGFVAPGKITIDRDWQLSVDKNHVKNIRAWLELIKINPLLCQDLLSALIINLTRRGVFIADTDLFQKDISAFLAAEIKPLFVQIKHLLRLFPVFFSEIGAEGEIRDISTEIDELSKREDRLIHFLRKQVHAESNNTHIHLVKMILRFWTDLDLKHLQGIIPEDFKQYLSTPDKRLQAQKKAVNKFLAKHELTDETLLDLSWQQVAPLFDSSEAREDFSLKRLKLLCHIYYLLLDKYQLNPYDIVAFLKKYSFFDQKEQGRLRQNLREHDLENSMHQMLNYIQRLNQIILDPAPTQAWENIYYKRHVAAGIPSMYGQYHEPKLEAMGMIFRLENAIKRLFEQLTSQLNLTYITAKTLKRIIRILTLFDLALKQEGFKNEAFGSALAMLVSSQRIMNLSLDQYLDMFKLMKDSINELINEYFYRFYEQELNLNPVMDKAQRSKTKQQAATQKQAEEFYRKLLSSSFMVQELDNFIAQILVSLNAMKSLFASIDIGKVMSYNTDMFFAHLYAKNSRLENQVLLGSKGFFLKRMYEYNFPIPPGFVITTELFRYRQVINAHPEISRELDGLVLANIRKLEEFSGLRYGDPSAPLLLSVRSGAPMSLPGAMSTFLNIGMNDEITLRLSHQPNYGWTAWDCYRRLIQSWGMAYGIDRDKFDAVMIEFKQKYHVEQKVEFTPEQMRLMSESYKKVLAEHGVALEQDTFLQIKEAIIHVLESWNTERARLYRQKLHIADEWGTAVIIQKMVLGNISLDSGTGVLFTHATWSSAPGINLNGDFTLCSQGEDVVAGLVHTLPISEAQRKQTKSPLNISLEKNFPAIYKKLERLASHLIENMGYPHQEIEFTFEGSQEDQLHILQTRNQVINKAEEYTVFDAPKRDMKFLGAGVGIGKGVLNGIIAFSREDIDKVRNNGHPIILVRPDTVPDDMDMLFECQGLLTSRGGVTSHAAVTATRLGLTGVVNCRELKVFDAESYCIIGEMKLETGDPIAIDATSGSIYAGHYPIETTRKLRAF